MSSQLEGALANVRLYHAVQQKHERLLRSEQARKQLTQMVVHDLKNPLTALRGFYMLLRMTNLTAEQCDLLARAEGSSDMLLQLVTDILDNARLQEGRLDLRRAPTAVKPLLTGCNAELHGWHKSRSR